MPAQKYQARFIQILELSPWNKHFRCAFPEGQEMDFIAGQFMMALIPRDGKVVRRAYSICSAPLHKKYVEFVITKVDGGFVSSWFHDRKVGDTIDLEGPHGHFVLKEPLPEEILFICTGSGVAPF